jgi:hypothetical protein
VVSTRAGVAATTVDSGFHQLSDVVYAGQGPKVYLLGDSVPYGLREHVPATTLAKYSISGSTVIGCTLFPAQTYLIGASEEEGWQKCVDWTDSRDSLFRTASPDLLLLWPGQYQQFDITVDGARVAQGTAGYRDWLDSQFDRLLAQAAGSAKHVAIVTVPCHRLLDSGNSPKAPIVNDDARVRWLNSALADYATRHRVPLIDLYGFSCGGGRDPEYVDGVAMRVDGIHYSKDGAAIIWDWLDGQIATILAGPSRGAGAP